MNRIGGGFQAMKGSCLVGDCWYVLCSAEARVKIARMTLTIKLDGSNLELCSKGLECAWQGLE